MENALDKKSSNRNVFAMISKHFRIKVFAFILVSMCLISACTPEYFIVKNFKETNNISVLILPCNVILNSNTTIVELYPDYAKLPKALQDTIWNANTKLLEKVPDSVVINEFYSSLIKQLRLSEVKIYSINEIDAFNALDSNAYVLKIAQIEMEENKKRIPYSEPVEYNYEVYKEVEVKTLSLNVWFEFTKASNDTVAPQVLYSSQTISDEVSGRFAQNINGSYDFKFKRNDIDANDILPLARIASLKMGQYFYNHLLNVYAKKVYQSYDYNLRYIGKQLDKQKGFSIYYPSVDERFIEISKTK